MGEYEMVDICLDLIIPRKVYIKKEFLMQKQSRLINAILKIKS
jgi:hypothetical protein